MDPTPPESPASESAPPVVEAPRDVVDVRFRVPGRARSYDARGVEVSARDLVVVETDRGPELGEVMAPPRPRWPDEEKAKLPRVIRRADANDLRRADHNRRQEDSARRYFLERSRELGAGTKLIRVDFRFDGGKAVFYFIGPERFDARGLARDLSQKMHTRVEMRQLGPRDETRVIGGIGPCGRELCCSSWLREFGPVSIKMAKAQDLSLNPSKLAGMCGRLKCCLRYEYDTYLALRRALPRIGKRVQTIKGNGVVVQQLLLKQIVRVEREEDGEVVECTLEDLVEKRAEAEGAGGEPAAGPAEDAPEADEE